MAVTTATAGSVADAVRDMVDRLMAAPAYRDLVTADATAVQAIKAVEQRPTQFHRDEERGQASAARRDLDQVWAHG